MSVVRNERLNPHWYNSRYYLLRALRRELENIISRYVSDAHLETLVDYGCGDMPYRSLFAPHLKNYQGFDLDNHDATVALLNTDGSLPLADGQADIVLSTQVLEHVVDPDLYLRECYRVLCSDGLLIMCTHGSWVYHPQPTDYWRWTLSGLCKIIEAQGFHISETTGLLGLAALGLQFVADAIIPRFPSLLQTSTTYISQKLIALLDRLHSPADRQNNAAVYIVVARKRPTWSGGNPS